MTQAPQKQMVGRVLAGRYHIEGVLGRGAMGSVYRVRDTQTNRICAIKLMAQFASLDESAYLRFIQEAQIVAQLYHPNIVQVYGFDRDEDGTPILAMELLEGDDLHTLLYDQPRMTLERTLEILRAVGQALHAAHSVGVLHRDIKPKNIFIAKQKNSRGEIQEVVKVVDFGLSKVLGEKNANETAPGIILGTAEYIPPEGTLGVPELLDFRADQWALGVVAYRLLSGRLPFEGNDPLSLLVAIRKTTPPPLRELTSGVPEHVLSAIERAMAKNKEDRFDSVQDFLRALDGLPTIGQVLSRSSDGVPALTGMDFSRRGPGGQVSGSLRLPQGSLGGSSANSGRHSLPGSPSSRSQPSGAGGSGEHSPSSRSGRLSSGAAGEARPRGGHSDRVAPVAAAMTADALPSMPPRSLFRTLEPGSEYSVHLTGHLVGSSNASTDAARRPGPARQAWVFLAVPTIALSTAGLLWLGQTHLSDRRHAGPGPNQPALTAPRPATIGPVPTTDTPPSPPEAAPALPTTGPAAPTTGPAAPTMVPEAPTMVIDPSLSPAGLPSGAPTPAAALPSTDSRPASAVPVPLPPPATGPEGAPRTLKTTAAKPTGPGAPPAALPAGATTVPHPPLSGKAPAIGQPRPAWPAARPAWQGAAGTTGGATQRPAWGAGRPASPPRPVPPPTGAAHPAPPPAASPPPATAAPAAPVPAPAPAPPPAEGPSRINVVD